MDSPVHLYLVEALGAVATSAPYFKLAEALRSGDAQAQENPLTNIRSLDLPRVQRHLSLTAHSYTPQMVFGNPAALEALGAHRAVVEDALREAMTWHRARAREMERDALGWLRARMDVVDLGPRERDAFRAAVVDAVDARIEAIVGRGRCAALRTAAAACGVGRTMATVRR